MSAPQNTLAFDEDQALAATERWLQRASVREANERALSEGRFDLVESPERLAKRVNRLRPRFVDQEGYGPDAPQPLSIRDTARLEVSPEEVDNPLVERMIGATRDLLSVEFLDQGRIAARSVARIVTRLSAGRFAYGTGFLVSPTVLLTNHHVLSKVSDAASSVAEFDYALDSRRQSLTAQRYRLQPDQFFLTNAEFDFSLVAVASVSELGVNLQSYPWLPLIADEGKILTGELVNVVQHPKGETKQVVVREGRLLDMPPRGQDPGVDPFTYYEADTEPGSSGSPVFNDQWEVIALHHSGVPRTDPQGRFLDTTGNVWQRGDDPTRLDWVANEGVRISRLMAFLNKTLQGLPADDAQRPFLAGVLSAATPTAGAQVPPDASGIGEAKITASDPPEEPPQPRIQQGTFAMTTNPASQIDISAGGGDVTITVPLRITIALGSPVATLGAYHPGAQQQPDRFVTSQFAIEENFKPDPDYTNRPGYDPAFLGFDLPLPTLDNSVAKQAARLADGGIELKYFHYSVIMNASRRIAFVSAVNVDVDARAQIGREGADTWSFDPRIPKSAQTGAELYRNNPIDKGHLTRRQDGAWGATQQEAQSGNDDTFHWTNCSPQHEVFNQSQKAASAGFLLWGNLENHVTEQAKLNKRRISVFNGPVFRKDDNNYRTLQLPRQFWKIIVMQGDDGSPNAVGFVLSQADLIANLPQENFDPGEFNAFQVRISEIERLTKLDFGDLRKRDALNVDGAERFFERDVPAVHIREPGDIVLHAKV